MGNFLDVAIVAVVLLFAYFGYKRGILGGLCLIGAAVIANLASKALLPLASPVVGKIIGPYVEKAAMGQTNEFVEKFLPTGDVGAFLDSIAQKGQEVILELAGEITLKLQDMVAFFIIFVIIVFVAYKILAYLSLNLPILKTLNKSVGWLVGAVVGVIVVSICISAFIKYSQVSGTTSINIPYLENSYIVSRLPALSE